MAQVEKLLIFLASPGDVQYERRYAEGVIQELNRTTAAEKGVVLDLVKWEEDAFPGYGKDAQALINDQIAVMANYELFVGIMWNRFGTPTPRAGSGTEEEFERAAAAHAQHGRPSIWLYFRNAKASFDTEEQLKQREKVLALKKRAEASGLPWSYKTPNDFRNKFREHLTKWLYDRSLKSEKESEKEAARDLTGDWIIDDGNSQYDARLKQVGSHVSGEYDLPGGTGFLDGLVEGNQVTLSWDQKFNQRGGGVGMEISSDGKKLDGKWNYDPEKYGSGLRGKGKWTFYRK
jgi:hypothetical protein